MNDIKKIKNKENIIFCLSYLNIPITIKLIEKFGIDKCIIITNIESIKKFFGIFYNKKIILFTKKPSNYSYFYKFKNPLKYFYKLFFSFYYIIKYSKLFSKLANKKIYFFLTTFGRFESFLINILSRNNKIYYKEATKLNHLERDTKIRSKLNEKTIKLVFGVEVDALKKGNETIYKISNEFLTKINSRKLNICYDINNIGEKVIKKFRLGRKKILFLAGNTVKSNFVNENEYVSKTDKLLKYLVGKYGKNEIAIKLHPRFNDKYSFEKTLYEIPKHIPVNLIYSNLNLIIGYASSVLFEAANNGSITISTIDYYQPKNTQTKTYYKKYLENNLKEEAKINYFKNLNELEDNLSEL